MAITMLSVKPSAGVSRSNETDAASAIAAKAPNRRTLFSQRSGRFLNASSLTTPAKVAPPDAASEQCRDGDGDESERGRQQTEIEHSPGNRPRQGDFERAPLPLAGDCRGRKTHCEHRRQNDRDRMDEAEGDRTREAEHISTAEAGELFRHYPALHQSLELRAEPRIDDGEHEAPDRQRNRDDRELGPLQTPGMPQ
jgi:hypothetical protein